MTTATTDVLICGAGAAGLTLAIELARRNIAFRLIDKASEPFRGSRGKGLQPRTLEVFDDLGVVDRVAAAGGLYPPQREYAAGGFEDKMIMDHKDATPDEPYPMIRMLPQFLTEGILRDRLAELGHHVMFGQELIGFTQDADCVSADIHSEHGVETVHARYLVGCDGGRSFVRHALDIGFPGTTLGVRAIVADLRMDGLSRDAWHRWDGNGLPLAICPLAGTDLMQLQGPVPMEGDIDLSIGGLGQLIAARTSRTDLRIHEIHWASVFTMNARLADKYQVGRVLLAGDAAHIHPPTGGQGLNTSIQDSYNLGWKLAALGGAPDTVLASYEAERRPVASEVLGLSTRLLDAAKQGNSMRRGRETHQLDLGYPDSALSLDCEISGCPVRAGDRAPDAGCRGAGGQQLRLFDLYRGPHWTLLGLGVPAIRPRPNLHIHVVGPSGEVTDPDGSVRSAYGPLPGWILVRPDGYIAATVAPQDCAKLEVHLERVGLVCEKWPY